MNKFLYILILLSIASCIDPIDFKEERRGRQLVIDGRISDDDGPHEVNLRRTTESIRISVPVTGATIYLKDDTGNEAPFFEVQEGKYLTEEGAITGIIGRSYHIKVTTVDGTEYISEPETLPARTATLDAMNYDFGRIDIFDSVEAFIDVNITDTTDPFYLRWDVEDVYQFRPTDYPDPFNNIPPSCYVKAYPNTDEAQLFDGTNIQVDKIIQKQIYAQKINETFKERHYINVYQRNLSQKSYIYWTQVNQTVASVGSIFDTPPAAIRGNISNINDSTERALGYFEAVSSDTIRIFLVPGFIPFDIPPYCEFDPMKGWRDYPRECFDCLDQANSSFEKPDYF